MPADQSQAAHTASNAKDTASIASSVSSIQRIKLAFRRRRHMVIRNLAAEDAARRERSRRAEVLFLSATLR
jgi:hypothetical protein